MPSHMVGRWRTSPTGIDRPRPSRPVTVSSMGTTYHGPSPWPHITRAIRKRGPRHAAIAYVGNDATIVRMILVPAVMELCGKANWWMPGRRAPKTPSVSNSEVGKEARI